MRRPSSKGKRAWLCVATCRGLYAPSMSKADPCSSEDISAGLQAIFLMISTKTWLAGVMHLTGAARRKDMRRALISSAVLSLMLLAGAPAKAQVSFGVQFGTPPPPPRAYRVPAQPRGDFVWVEGFWDLQGRRYKWHDGYWARPPFAGAYWIAPYYDN